MPRLDARLRGLAERCPAVQELRGLGLIRGVRIAGEAADVVARARELGLLVVGAGPDVVRLLPPLDASDDLLDRGVDLLEDALA